ncbi:MAG: hypothetical protein IJ480_07160 [Clostridia bacterium]|nr:hypothetical protein [Clostridia bacterium]
MRSRSIRMLFCVCFAMLIPLLLPLQAAADTGPKPSVRITFENMGDTLCYGTLLSESESTGPSSAWDGTEEDAMHSKNERFGDWLLDYDIWKAFVEYADPDGFYFLQEGWCVSETGELNWTYYPPTPFKILLYYPETETFVSSGILERYAFDSYFTVDMTGFIVTEGTFALPETVKSYPYLQEILTFCARCLLTIAVEMAAAFLFGFRYRKGIHILFLVNLVTQLFLNLTLQITNPGMGGLMFLLTYAFLEIVIVIAEAVLYCKLLPKTTDDPPEEWLCVLYAIVANTLSFFTGLLLSEVLPGLF